MNDRSKMRKTGVLILIGTLACILALLVFFRTGSGKGPEEKTLFLENDRGTYNLMEVDVPEGKGPFPVVFMAHGFAGTLHSGGAEELGSRLASRGILAVRIDFDPYLEPDLSAERTHIYPLSQMNSDAVAAIDKAVKEYGGDPDNVMLYGRSYGGRLVMQMANESSGGYDYRKLALVAPAGDKVAFRRYLGGDEKYEAMRKEAFGDAGFALKQGVRIVPQWFEDVESYDPCEFGHKFGDKPVLLFYNTKDTVVYPDTSVRCAEAYKDHEIIQVTTDDGHGYEMGFKESELKEMIMDRITDFLAG